MRIATAIRKSVKWGGAALAIVLLVAWIGSGWWAVHSPILGDNRFLLGSGAVAWVSYPALRSLSDSWRWIYDSPFPFVWWFSYVDNGGYYCLHIPLWAPLLFTLIVTGFAWRADLIARRRAMLGKCTKCGYARAGLAPDAVCPECGSAAAVA